MILHLKEYANKLKKYSHQLDNFAILKDQPWITNFDNPLERCVYIFRDKNNDLITSRNGKVTKGSWDYLPSMKSLLIELDESTTLYNQGFFDDSIMILKKDGTNEYQLFVNENKIESSVEKLLEKIERNYLVNSEFNVNNDNQIRFKDDENKKFEFISESGIITIFTRKQQGYEVGDRILLNKMTPKDGKIKLGFWSYIYVKNGRIIEIK